jgi:hypothetical protein
VSTIELLVKHIIQTYGSVVKPIIQIMTEYTENCQTLCSPQGFPETETEQYSVSQRGTEFASKTGTEK